MAEVATAVTVSRDGRYLYLAGGNADLESTGGGYLATFRRLAGGGLRPVGCVSTAGTGLAIGNVPIWLAPLPHTDTVLELTVHGNRGDGIVYGGIDASTPSAGGALGAAIPLSHNLSLTTTGSVDPTEDRSAPAIRVHRVAR